MLRFKVLHSSTLSLLFVSDRILYAHFCTEAGTTLCICARFLTSYKNL